MQGDAAAFARGRTFASTAHFVNSSGGSGSAPIGVATDAGGNLILTISGTPFTLTRDPATGRYTYSDPTGAAVVEAALSDHVGSLLLVTETPGSPANQFAGAFLVVGTPSTDVGTQSGSAIYIGPSAYLAAAQNGAVNGGSGGFILEADFDTASVDGVIALTDASTSTRFQIGFANAPISGAGFTATNLQQNGLNATVTSSNLDAAFYGPGAAQVGGTYRMGLSSGSVNSNLTGVFIGNRQSFTAADLAAAAAAAQSGQATINVGGETIVLGSGSVVGGSGSVYPNGASTYYNSNTGVSFGADGGGCYYVGDWSNC